VTFVNLRALRVNTQGFFNGYNPAKFHSRVSQSLPTNFGVFFAFLFGLAFGSFLNVVIYRVPRGLSVVKPRSACPNCGAAIRAYDNIPVLSWILLLGKCRDCKYPITSRYAVVELLCGFLFVSAYFYAAPINSTVQLIAFIKFCVFFFLLLGLIFIDFEHHLLPDVMTLPGTMLGLIFSLFVPVGGMPAFITRRLLTLRWPLAGISFIDSLMGAVIGALFIYAVGEIYFRVRHIEGMGLGDVKLMAMVGAFLGPKLTLVTIFAGAILGTVFGLFAVGSVWRKRLLRRKRRSEANVLRRSWRSALLMLRYYEVPFGVFLGSMAIVSTFYGNQIVDFYLGFYP
jgi:leader peptidase (prepilin peptidase)/N-methyltransferase